MTWSFSVTEKTESDAVRVFENAVITNRGSIPDDLGEKLKAAARILVNDSAANRLITISTAGHHLPNGTLSATLSFHTRVAPEETPDTNEA